MLSQESRCDVKIGLGSTRANRFQTLAAVTIRPPRATCRRCSIAYTNDDLSTSSRASMTQKAGGPPAASWTSQQQNSIFRIRAPLKRIFDKFPLVQYDENHLPLRAPKDKSQNVLHVFTTEEEAKSGKPSYNPGCLKWQVWTIACSGA